MALSRCAKLSFPLGGPVGAGASQGVSLFRERRSSCDRLDAVVGKYAGMRCDGGQFSVFAVGVDLEQVAALAVTGSDRE
jgi:hypothetical protein